MNLEAVIDKNRVRQAFSRQAPVYETNATLQKDVAEKLVSIMGFGVNEFRSPQSAIRTLDIGIGTGFATKEFLLKFPDANAFGCDIAWGMLKEAGRTGATLSEADADHLPYKDETFDLAFSSLALQWTNIQNSIREAFRVLRPHGRFYFSTFGEKTLRELADSYSSAWSLTGSKGTPETMKFESSQEIKSLMESAGSKDVVVKTDLIICRYQSPETLLRSLKAIGAGNPSKEFHPSRTTLNEAFRLYKDRYGDKDGITATFEVVYASGMKG